MGEVGETEVDALKNFLSSGELHLSSSESFDGVGHILGGGSDTHEDLTNLDSGSLSLGLAVGTSHTGLESISTGAGKHLVDAVHVPRMAPDSHVEVFFSGVVDHELVTGDSGSLQGF